MSDNCNSRRPIIALLVLVFVVLPLILPVAYLLSAGPALWLVNHGYLDAWTYMALYRPVLAFAYDHPTFNDAMNWYLSWWGDPIPLPNN